MRIRTSFGLLLAGLTALSFAGLAAAAPCGNGSGSGSQNKAGIQSGSSVNTIYNTNGTVTLTPNNGQTNPSIAQGGIYTWSRVAGAAVTFSQSTGAAGVFTLNPGASGHSVTIRLTVTGAVCDNAVPATNDVVIQFNNPNNYSPVAQVSASPASAAPGATISLIGNTSYDPDGDPVRYAWTQVATGAPSVSIISPSTANAGFVAPNVAVTTTFRFRLTVTEDLAPAANPLFGSATVDVNVVPPASNQPPTAVLNCPIEIGEGETLTLDGTASSDTDGTLSYSFVQDVGFPIATLPPSPHGSSISFAAPSLGGLQPGNIKFLLTVTDDDGASASDDCTVFILDKTAPVIAGANDILVAAEDAAGAHASFDVTWTDNVDGGPNPAVCSPVSGSVFPLGVTPVNCSATDSSDNVSNASFTVTVTDQSGPVIAPRGDEVVEATSAAGAISNYATPGTTDNVDPPGSASCVPPSGSQFPLGGTTVNCSASDAAGNAATPTSFSVIVQDTTAPSITPPPAQTFEATGPLTPLDSSDYGSPTVTDAVGIAEQSNDAPAQFPLGDTTITWYAKDTSGNSSTATTVITLEDTTAPTFDAGSYPDLVREASSAAGAVATFTPTASDAVDASPTIECTPASGSTFPLGDTTVNCTATDDAGNVGNASFNVKVQDTTAPTLSLPANIVAEATGPSGAAVSYTATASDIVDPSPLVSCLPVSGSTFPLATTTVNCSATDASGNTSTGTFTVKVQDTTAPVIAFHANEVATATSGAGAIVTYTLPTASDAVSGSVLVTCTPASGSLFPLGVTTVNCSATDGAGNTGTSSFTVTVSFAFNGFFRPIDNLPVVNVVKAGQAIPVKFSLGGNMGLNIFAAGYPKSNVLTCSSGAPTDVIEETVTAGGSSLSYDPLTGQYNYVWKTDKGWAGQCRQLIVKFADGNTQVANFNFTR